MQAAMLNCLTLTHHFRAALRDTECSRTPPIPVPAALDNFRNEDLCQPFGICSGLQILNAHSSGTQLKASAWLMSIQAGSNVLPLRSMKYARRSVGKFMGMQGNSLGSLG